MLYSFSINNLQLLEIKEVLIPLYKNMATKMAAKEINTDKYTNYLFEQQLERTVHVTDKMLLVHIYDNW